MNTYKPRKGSHYYMINSRFEVRQAQHIGSAKSNARIAAGNCFKTKMEAHTFLMNMRLMRRKMPTSYNLATKVVFRNYLGLLQFFVQISRQARKNKQSAEFLVTVPIGKSI